jgi:hypothetical protein
MTKNRLRDPELIHQEFLRDDMDAVTAADVLRRQTESDVFRNRFPVPVVGGRWSTGDAQRGLLEAMTNLGLIQDDTELGDLAEVSGFGPTPTVVPLTAAGSTATANIEAGHDNNFTVRVLPSGTGITTGNIFTVTFAVPRGTSNYSVHVSPGSSDARVLGGVVGRAARTGDTLTVATAAALTTGGSYHWDIAIGGQEY